MNIVRKKGADEKIGTLFLPFDRKAGIWYDRRIPYTSLFPGLAFQGPFLVRHSRQSRRDRKRGVDFSVELYYDDNRKENICSFGGLYE